ncbi:MAG: ATP-binding protein [Gemmatimonadaceae bacterium]|jgi:signal transduction histidine kinase|nr:ATP-binding protein [Gemmatimonadaceae bacterium]
MFSLDLLPHPIVVLDRDWRLRHANPSAERLLAPGTGIGDPLFSCMPVLREVIVDRLLRHVVETGHPDRTVLFPPETFALSGVLDVIASPIELGVVIELRERAPIAARPDDDDTARLGAALVEAGMALASALDLEHVLRVVVASARELLDARYAALGVLNAEGDGLAEFIFSGMTPEQQSRMPHKPRGRGILGLLISDARPMRLRDLSAHPVSVGFPKDHPHMRSFIGAPVSSRGRIFGNLYVTEKIGADEFTEADLAIVRTLAAQAAVAIENAELRRERDRFFAAASHELGNAVTGARMWARLLAQNPPETREAWLAGLRKLISGTEHAGRLIDDLLSTSRLNERRLTMASSTVDVGELVVEVMAHLEPESEEGGVAVTVKGVGEYLVRTDPVRVRQILVNLLANAVKFTPPGGRIEMRLERTGDGGVVIAVKDEGPGIAAEDLERIFRPFEQVVGIAKGRGSGLGLPLSRQLAQMLGGTLTTVSEPGYGATFTLRLPAAMPERDEAVRGL